jgi:hypothetical protein
MAADMPAAAAAVDRIRGGYAQSSVPFEAMMQALPRGRVLLESALDFLADNLADLLDRDRLVLQHGAPHGPLTEPAGLHLIGRRAGGRDQGI